jgi:hypothetical protein
VNPPCGEDLSFYRVNIEIFFDFQVDFLKRFSTPRKMFGLSPPFP